MKTVATKKLKPKTMLGDRKDGAKLAKAIEDLGLNQKEFAALVKRNPQTINNSIHGRLKVAPTLWDLIGFYKNWTLDDMKAKIAENSNVKRGPAPKKKR